MALALQFLHALHELLDLLSGHGPAFVGLAARVRFSTLFDGAVATEPPRALDRRWALMVPVLPLSRRPAAPEAFGMGGTGGAHQ